MFFSNNSSDKKNKNKKAVSTTLERHLAITICVFMIAGNVSSSFIPSTMAFASETQQTQTAEATDDRTLFDSSDNFVDEVSVPASEAFEDGTEYGKIGATIFSDLSENEDDSNGETQTPYGNGDIPDEQINDIDPASQDNLTTDDNDQNWFEQENPDAQVLEEKQDIPSDETDDIDPASQDNLTTDDNEQDWLEQENSGEQALEDNQDITGDQINDTDSTSQDNLTTDDNGGDWSEQENSETQSFEEDQNIPDDQIEEIDQSSQDNLTTDDNGEERYGQNELEAKESENDTYEQDSEPDQEVQERQDFDDTISSEPVEDMESSVLNDDITADSDLVVETERTDNDLTGDEKAKPNTIDDDITDSNYQAEYPDVFSVISDVEMENETEATEEESMTASANNGYCGDNVTWELDEAGNILISGEGAMYNYALKASPFYMMDQIVSIRIADGVSSIGDYAFNGCSNLARIDIPVSVNKIGTGAFTDCEMLADFYYSGTQEEWNTIEGGDIYLTLAANLYVIDNPSPVAVPIENCAISEFTKKEYTGQEQLQDIVIKYGNSELVEGNDYRIEYSNNINAGTATVTIIGTGSYKGTIEKKFNIAAKKIEPSVILSNNSFVYNNTIQKPIVTVCDGSTVLSENDYSLSFDQGLKNVGTYHINVVLKRNYSGTNTVTYKITAKKITPEVTLSQSSFVYNGNVQKPTITVMEGSTKINSSNYDVTFGEDLKNVGTYNISVKLKGNYSGSKAVSYKITPKKIAPEVKLSTSSYVYDGKVKKPSVTVYDGQTKMLASSYLVSYSEGLTDVGTYNVNVKLKGNYSGTKTAVFKITPKEVTPSIELTKTAFVYNGKIQKPGVTVKIGGTKLAASKYQVTWPKGLTNAGTYKIVCKLKDNYSGSKAVTYKITPKKITPEVKLSTSSYVYDGKVKKPSVTVHNGQTKMPASAYTVSYSEGLKNVGTYKVSVKLKGNYSGTKTVTFKINPKKVTPSVKLTKTAFVFNGKVQRPGVTVKIGETKLASSKYQLTWSKGLTNTGTYKIICKLKGNYSGSKTVSYKITPKKITPGIKLSKSLYTYDGKVKKPAVTVYNGKTKMSASTYTVSFPKGLKNAGTYKVSVKLKGNYSGTKTATFKINPKKVTPSVNLTKSAFVYNGKIQKPGITVKIGGTKLASSKYQLIWSKGLTNVGTYNIVCKLKGNYTGTKTVSYKINPQATSIRSAVGFTKTMVVKWGKKDKQITGYQIQYCPDRKFATGTRTMNVVGANNVSKTINKPVSGKNYYVRLRTYKKAGKKTFYSTWSPVAYTATKQVIKSKTKVSLNDDVSYTFTTTNSMMFVVPIKLTMECYDILEGGVRIVLKNSAGRVLQNDFINLKGYTTGDTYENWFYSDAFFVGPGTYTYTIINTASDEIYAEYSILSYLKRAATATIKQKVSVRSGYWIKVGRLGEGCPLLKSVYFSDETIIPYYDIDIDGTVWLYADKKGKAKVTFTLISGNKYTCEVNVTAGNPNFFAYLSDYYTRDNYFVVKIKNLRPSPVTVIKKGAKVENDDYKSYDRNIKSTDRVIIKSGETKYLKFYVDGDTTWPEVNDFTLCAKIEYEGVTYDWHVWNNDTSYKDKDGKWYGTYWTDDEDAYADWY